MSCHSEKEVRELQQNSSYAYITVTPCSAKTERGGVSAQDETQQSISGQCLMEVDLSIVPFSTAVLSTMDNMILWIAELVCSSYQLCRQRFPLLPHPLAEGGKVGGANPSIYHSSMQPTDPVWILAHTWPWEATLQGLGRSVEEGEGNKATICTSTDCWIQPVNYF